MGDVWVTRPETYSFEGTGGFPNSRLPVLVYRNVEAAQEPNECIAMFAHNGWLGAWVNGLFHFHRFHSTAHEVLGVVAGSGSVVLGGPKGRTIEVMAGDVLVLPAGVAHSNGRSAADFVVVGAYPNGMSWDLCQGDPAGHDEVVANIDSVPFPDADPVYGPEGPLMRIWRHDSGAFS
jgi:uncharacterized protein YjlB